MFMEGERLRAEFGEETVADLSIGQPLEAPEAVVEAFAAASRFCQSMALCRGSVAVIVLSFSPERFALPAVIIYNTR